VNPGLPKERLATTDETGKRVFLYPAAVKGYFKSLKSWVHPTLIVFFLTLPWVHVNGRQLLLLDVGHREFFFFGLHFRSHDAPLLLFLFLAFTFLIGLITAIWGRLWCGWACPQTVFTESVFRRLETWIEGSHRQRKALDRGPWSKEKIVRKSLKWIAFSFVSLLITHSFLAYFVGSYEIIRMVSTPPAENWASFLIILATTGVILFDFGWFREQFCVIMCPYGRFQSVLLDSNSLVVAYDVKRGEPRRDITLAENILPQGDCVNCLRCVQVCPTGIDIRRGLQMECIACTACIDACDEVMEKIKKPSGLIRYTTLSELAEKTRKIFTTRSFAYAALLLASLGALAITLGNKDFLDITILRARGAPYQMETIAGQPRVVNQFKLDISNQTGREELVEVKLSRPWLKSGVELVMPMNKILLPDNARQAVTFFLRFPPTLLNLGARKIILDISTLHSPKNLEVTLVGPNS
jgi:cytochrome c oxidase accessory protein FixG